MIQKPVNAITTTPGMTVANRSVLKIYKESAASMSREQVAVGDLSEKPRQGN